MCERKFRVVDYLRTDQVRQILLDLMLHLMQGKDELNNMDSACGDGDFGTTVWVSFSSAREQVSKSLSRDIGSLLVTAGQAILSSGGGAAGPVFGSFFIEAGKVAGEKHEVAIADLARMFDASLIRIKGQGGARVGDKTVIDALEPAVDALKASASKGVSLPVGLDNAANSARAGCESTKRIVARQGKARYLGEQTLGYVDPGAHVIAIIFEFLAEKTASKLRT
jgi:dihydroxyacetone kinase-like protein